MIIIHYHIWPETEFSTITMSRPDTGGARACTSVATPLDISKLWYNDKNATVEKETVLSVNSTR